MSTLDYYGSVPTLPGFTSPGKPAGPEMCYDSGVNPNQRQWAVFDLGEVSTIRTVLLMVAHDRPDASSEHSAIAYILHMMSK